MRALIVTNMQNDFCEEKNTEINGVSNIIPIINELTSNTFFDLVIMTKDWHPHDNNYCNICIQNTQGSDIHKDINLNLLNLYFFKMGAGVNADSYSAFYDNDHKTSTGLYKFLKDKEINDVYVTGLFTNSYIKHTAIDSTLKGFNTYVIWDACVGTSDDLTSTLDELVDNEVNIIDVDYLSIKN